MIIVRAVTCDDAISAGIRFAEYGYWASHIETLTPEGKLLGAHFDGGVQARERNYDAGKFTRERYLNLPADDAMTAAFYAWCKLQEGKPYDATAIAAFVARRDWRSPGEWFCSELIAAGLEIVKWFPFDLATDVNKVMPRDLLLILSGRIDVSVKQEATSE
jgi:hypothetical protein